MRGRTHEDSVVESDLRRWGFWLGVQYAADGYPPTSTIEHIFSGRAHRPGHRILCVDPKPESRFWEINSRVLMLRRELYEALVAKYALPCKPGTAQHYSPHELAEFLRITPESFLMRLGYGRRGYKRLVFAETRSQENLALSAALG